MPTLDRSSRSPRIATRPAGLLTGVFLAAAVLFLAFTFKPSVSGDGVGYFSYLHSLVVDHDLDMSNEYAAALKAGVDVWRPDVTTRTQTGLLADQFPVGPALLSAPAYLVALALRPSGEPQFGPPFTTAYTLASLFYGLLALALAYRLARAVGSGRSPAITATVAIALTSPLLYYLVYQPSYSHLFSAFMVTAFLYLWWTRRGRRTAVGWILLGLLGGVMALVRWQDGPLLAVTWLDLPKDRWRLLLMVPGSLIGFSPQLIVDRVIFGIWLPVRPAAESLDPLHGHYLQVLFSSWHGLFTWTPVLLVATVGLFFIRDRTFRAACLLAFLVELFITGAYPVWWGGFSFGMRYLINLTPFFVVGLATIAERLRPRLAAPGIAVFTGWSLLLIASMTYVIRQDVNPGALRLLADQVQAIHYLPHLVQGYVVRALFLWPVLHQRPDLVGGLAVLAVEVLAVGSALLVAGWGRSEAVRPIGLRLASSTPHVSGTAMHRP